MELNRQHIIATDYFLFERVYQNCWSYSFSTTIPFFVLIRAILHKGMTSRHSENLLKWKQAIHHQIYFSELEHSVCFYCINLKIYWLKHKSRDYPVERKEYNHWLVLIFPSGEFYKSNTAAKESVLTVSISYKNRPYSRSI